MPRLALFPLLVALLAPAAIMAEDKPQLDASKPMDAVKIINIITADVQMTRRNAAVFQAALETLAKLAAADEKATAEIPPPEKADSVPATPPAKPGSEKKK